MKKVMQNKSLLHRLIALTMAVVMTLTLVAIDSHFICLRRRKIYRP